MAGFELRIDGAGIGEILRGSEMRGVIDGLAAAIAGDVREYDEDAEATVNSYTFDRAAASVAFLHPRSMDLQARDGVLTRAAARQGLEVKAR